jgi:hypothetical protein
MRIKEAIWPPFFLAFIRANFSWAKKIVDGF